MNIKFVSIALVLAALLGAGMIKGEEQLIGVRVVTNAVAKIGCSCVFVAERSLEACLADNPPGFDIASATVDREERAVHSSLYWIVRGTARYQGRAGCTLD